MRGGPASAPAPFPALRPVDGVLRRHGSSSGDPSHVDGRECGETATGRSTQRATPHGGRPVTEEDIRRALSSVQDPELRKSIVELGMVRDIVAEDARIGATIVLTTAGCPLRNQIRAEAEQALTAIAKGRVVEIKLDARSCDERDALAARLNDRHELVHSLFGPGSRTRTIAVASGKGGVGKSTVK